MNKKLLLIVPLVLIALGILLFLALRFGRQGIAPQENAAGLPSLTAQAKDQEAAGSLIDAKNTYQRLVNEFPGSTDVMNWQKKVEGLNIKLLFSPVITAGTTQYEIQPGDTLDKIARDYKTTVDLIMKSNNLTSDKIMPGKKIKVWKAPFSIFVDKSQNILLLKNGEEIIKTYIVSTGKDNSTPVGNFKITNKLVNPTWFKSGAVIPAGSPENILGSRWLGLDLAGYGIHGTTEPQNLGKQVTQGCVRMSGADVEELYIIIPLGTEVVVVD